MSVGLAVVTGGKGGLATVIAEIWRKAGWTVLAPGREDLDVTDSAQTTRFFATIPSLDALILNAGRVSDALFLSMDEVQWDESMAANLSSAFFTARAALPALTKGRTPHIIALASHAALRGRAGQCNYAAAKAGVIAFAKSLARELGPQGIRCNAVSPGFMDTPMTAHLSEAARHDLVREHVLPTLSQPRDVARFLLALQSLPAVSGQHFSLDSRITPWS